MILKLTRENKLELIKTVKKCVSRTKAYVSGNKKDRVKVLTVNALAILHNMSLLGFDDESRFVPHEYINMYKNMRNNYILSELAISYDDLETATTVVSKELRVAFGDYSKIAETILTNEEDTYVNVTHLHSVLTKNEIYLKLLTDISFATNKNVSLKRIDAFFENPKKIIIDAGSSLRSAAFYMILQNLNSVQNFKEELIASKNKEFSNVYEDKYLHASGIQNSDNFDTALINMKFYLHRFNGTINEILVNREDNEVYKKVLDCVAESIRECKLRNITTVVQCMNLIINNLVVTSVGLTDIQNEIKSYAAQNYKNRYHALLNVSAVDAIRKAHNILYPCANDAFDTTLPKV